jgi:hypothetical protein
VVGWVRLKTLGGGPKAPVPAPGPPPPSLVPVPVSSSDPDRLGTARAKTR